MAKSKLFFFSALAPPTRARAEELELPLCIPFWHITLWNISFIYNLRKPMNKAIYSQTHKGIIEKLKQARIATGLDQKEAGKLLGKTQSYVSKIEPGQRRVDVVQLKSFAKIYKKPLNFFID